MSKDPFHVGRAVKGRDFINRDLQIHDILQRLSKGESTIAVGEPGVGKTSLLFRIKDPLVQKKYVRSDVVNGWSIFYKDGISINKSFTVEKFWSEALQSIKGNPYINEEVAELIKDAKKSKFDQSDLRYVFEAFDRNKITLILLLDNFEEFLANANEDLKDISFLGFLQEVNTTIGGLALLISSKCQASKLLSLVMPHFPGTHLFSHTSSETIGGFDGVAVEKLFKRTSPRITQEEKIFIQRVTGPNPYLLQALARTLRNTPLSDDKLPKAASKFYDERQSHFLAVWDNLKDAEQTVAVMLAIKNLNGRVLGSSYNYGEIENLDLYHPELQSLEAKGLAQVIAKTSKGWYWDPDHYLIWHSHDGSTENWAMGCESFTWWIKSEILEPLRDIPSYKDWLRDKKYKGVITQKQWNELKAIANKIPLSTIKGVAILARALLKEIQGSLQ
ncbi:MAG: hypothetical protein WBW94_12165 [Anaerolineales bacterium]